MVSGIQHGRKNRRARAGSKKTKKKLIKRKIVSIIDASCDGCPHIMWVKRGSQDAHMSVLCESRTGKEI